MIAASLAIMGGAFMLVFGFILGYLAGHDDGIRCDCRERGLTTRQMLKRWRETF